MSPDFFVTYLSGRSDKGPNQGLQQTGGIMGGLEVIGIGECPRQVSRPPLKPEPFGARIEGKDLQSCCCG
jgi:hypothetical protein